MQTWNVNCSHMEVWPTDVNVWHSFFWLYYSIICLFPYSKFAFYLHVLQVFCFWVQTNLIGLSFNSILWFNPILSVTSQCKTETTNPSLHTCSASKLGICSSWWDFTHTNPIPTDHIPDPRSPAYKWSMLTIISYAPNFLCTSPSYLMPFTLVILILNLWSRNLKWNMTMLGKDIDVINIKKKNVKLPATYTRMAVCPLYPKSRAGIPSREVLYEILKLYQK